MKTAERIVMVVLLLVLVGGGVWIYLAVTYEQASVREAVARGDYEIPTPLETEKTLTEEYREDSWREYFPSLVSIIIGSTTVQASVADSLPERIKGLSETPYMPKEIVKLFVFGVPGEHSIWMKDMNYALDIIWVSDKGIIVHIEENVSPATYPESFSSPTPAWYVIETNAGFVKENQIKVGNTVVVPS